MLSVKVLSPSAGGLSNGARRTTTMIGSRLSILPVVAWSKGLSLRPRLGKLGGAAARGFRLRTFIQFFGDNRLTWRGDGSGAWSGDGSLDQATGDPASYLTPVFGSICGRR